MDSQTQGCCLCRSEWKTEMTEGQKDKREGKRTEAAGSVRDIL